MGNHCTQVGFTNLGTLWDNIPAGGEVIITRERITISDSPRLNIGKSVLTNDVKPSTYGQLMVSLSDLQYGEDSYAILSPKIRVRDPRMIGASKALDKVEESKYEESLPSPLIEDRSSMRAEFIPELTAVGVYDTHTQSKEDPPSNFLTPETQSDDSLEFSARGSNKTDSLFQLPPINTDSYDYLTETSPTTLFTTRSIAEQNMRDLQNFLKQQQSSSRSPEERSIESKFDQKISPTISPKAQNDEDKVALIRLQRRPTVFKTEAGIILSKKLATQAEQKGMRECHVYFTPRTSAEIWPPLVVTVGEEWDFVKVMRKAIANLQRSMIKGEREGTHDWLYDYNPNKDIRKIKKDLKVLFGRKVVSFRDSHLKKSLKDVSSDFINKMWILQKDDDKHQKARMRSSSFHNMRDKKERSRSPLKRRANSFSKKKKVKAQNSRYTRLSRRI